MLQDPMQEEVTVYEEGYEDFDEVSHLTGAILVSYGLHKLIQLVQLAVCHITAIHEYCTLSSSETLGQCQAPSCPLVDIAICRSLTSMVVRCCPIITTVPRLM